MVSATASNSFEVVQFFLMVQGDDFVRSQFYRFGTLTGTHSGDHVSSMRFGNMDRGTPNSTQRTGNQQPLPRARIDSLLNQLCPEVRTSGKAPASTGLRPSGMSARVSALQVTYSA